MPVPLTLETFGDLWCFQHHTDRFSLNEIMLKTFYILTILVSILKVYTRQMESVNEQLC